MQVSIHSDHTQLWHFQAEQMLCRGGGGGGGGGGGVKVPELKTKTPRSAHTQVGI